MNGYHDCLLRQLLSIYTRFNRLTEPNNHSLDIVSGIYVGYLLNSLPSMLVKSSA